MGAGGSSRERAVTALMTVVAVVAGMSAFGVAPAGASGALSVTPASGPAYAGDAPDPDVLYDPGTAAYYAFTTGTTWGNHLGVLRSGHPNSGFAPFQVSGSFGSSALPNVPSWERIDTQNAPGVYKWGSTWIMFYDAERLATGRHCLSVATSSSPTAAFVDSSSGPLWCDADGSKDPQPFVDPQSGAPYLLWKNHDDIPGPTTSKVWSVPLQSDGIHFAGSPTMLLQKDSQTYPWETTVDDPSMIFAGGQYDLFFSGGDWKDGSYTLGYAVCSGPSGPCSQPPGNQLLSSYPGVAGPGGGTAFQDAGGSWWMSYHGCPSASTCPNPRELYVGALNGATPCAVAPAGPGQIQSNGIAMSPDAGGAVHELACAPTGPVKDRSSSGGAWSNPSTIGGTATSDPDVVLATDGRRILFVRGVDGSLWGNSITSGGTVQGWFGLGGLLSSSPGAAASPTGQVDVVVAGADGALWHRAFSAGSWFGWEALGGAVAYGSAPDAVWVDANTFTVFVRGVDDGLWTRTWKRATGWTGWSSLGGAVRSGVTAVASNGTVDVFGVGTDGAVWTRSSTGSWGPWSSLGGVSTSAPHAAAVGSGIRVVIRGGDGNVWSRTRTSGGWAAWAGEGSFP